MKKIVFCYLLIIFGIISCTQTSHIPEEVYYSVDHEKEDIVLKPQKPAVEDDKKEDNKTDKSGRKSIINAVIEYSKTFIGVPYKWGGTTPSGFDCSGFIMYVYQNNNVDMPRSITDMVKISDRIDKKDILPGDLVFFKGSNINSSDIGHVALVIEKTPNSFKMIHATSSKGIMINDFDQYEYWTSRYLFATRIKDEYFK